MSITMRARKTAPRRLRDAALYWGLPVTAVEIVLVPPHPWSVALRVAVLSFLVVTTNAFFIELAVVKFGQRRTGPDT